MSVLRKVAFAVNGSPMSAMGVRARGLASRLGATYEPHFVYRPAGGKLAAAQAMARVLAALDPDLLYVLDMGISGVLASWRQRWRRRVPWIVDTGDAITALALAARLRGPLGVAATWLLEESSLRSAHRIVVRGSFHREILSRRGIEACWIPDGFEKELFFPEPKPACPDLVVGLLGSVVWNGSIEATYGWDLVELLAALPEAPLRGLLIGGGSGLHALREYATKRGVAHRLEFVGQVPYEKLRSSLNRLDIALSTQTNDLPGQVRTTGKLPLYLACGRFILASRVGEASRVLPECMLLDYKGSRDLSYPARLALRVQALLAHPESLHAEGLAVGARQAPQFEYAVLSDRVKSLLDSL